MMEKPKQNLGGWDFPDRVRVPDGYDMKSIPDLTSDNFNMLIDEHNKLVDLVISIAEKLGIELSD